MVEYHAKHLLPNVNLRKQIKPLLQFSFHFVLTQQHILLEINIFYDDEEVEYLSK